MDNDSSQLLIAALRNPKAYPHPVTVIQVVETHISWVLLTGTFAYKFKKPVDLGFVDFTTLERRRFCCLEELRLNRRLAAELYLDVVPVTGTADAPRVGGTGEPIEFAVKMLQFPQEELLTRVLECSGILPEDMDDLAREVARFHGRVAVALPDSPYGSSERVQSPVRANFESLISVASGDERQSRLENLRSWIEQEFAAREKDFTLRKQAGFIRECHGDMHLGNMILINDRITIFDCIEFNPDLRWIDVLSEAAFLVMDLDDRGQTHLARRFLNGYLEATGDYLGVSILPYYLTYRALVRAKVAGIRLGQAGLSSEKQDRLRDEIRGYLELAASYTERTRPHLIITHGLSGSGKTTGTQALVEALGAIRIRSDVERKRLFGLDSLRRSNSDVGEAMYDAEATHRTYARLQEIAAAILKAGFPVIVDATFLRRADRDVFRELAQRLDVPFLLLEFHAPEETLRNRISRRESQARDASEANLKVLERQIAGYESLGDDERNWALSVDSTAPAAGQRLIRQVAVRHSPNI